MRLLRELDEAVTASLVHEALEELGIANSLSQGKNGSYSVWVVEEGLLDKAQELTGRWLDEGARDELERFALHGRRRRAEQRLHEEQRARMAEELRTRLLLAARPGSTRLTWGVVALCSAIFVLSDSFGLESTMAALAIADPTLPVSATELTLFGFHFTWLALPWHQPWRFFTPVLVHHDAFHLLFNMLVMVQPGLGRMLEMRHGSRTLLGLIVVSGVISNIAQYELSGSPAFAGFSGVVYALLGFLWLRGKRDPNAGYRLTQSAIGFMLLWLAWGFMGSLGNVHIANYCHLFGLLVGMAWGAWSARAARR